MEPMKNRGCTDVVCLLLFSVFLAGWGGVSYMAFTTGNPELIVYPSNSSGFICGRGDNKNKEYVMFHDLTKCLGISAALGCSTPQVCVENCPSEESSLKACLLLSPGGLGCNGLLETYREYCLPMTDAEWEEAKKDPDNLMKNRICPSYTLSSIPVIGRCVPDFGIIENLPEKNTTITDGDGGKLQDEDGNTIDAEGVFKVIKYLTELLNAREIAEKLWADLISSWYLILGGQVVSLVVSFLWILLLRFLTGPMIYLSILSTLGLMGVSTAYSWIKYSSIQESQEGEGIFDINPITSDLSTYLALRDTWLVFFVLSMVIFVIVLLIIIFLRSRISLAIELIKESSKAVSSIISSLFFPVMPFILQALVVGYFCIVAAYLASSGKQEYVVAYADDCPEGGPENGDACEPETFSIDSSSTCEPKCIFNAFTPSDLSNYLQIYNLFGLFWGLFFVSAFGEMVLAGAFASWYWALDKSRDVPTFALTASTARTTRYHLGTLAFGSLIIAILRMIRVMLQYIEDKIKEKGMDNIFTKIVLCLCKCGFWCLEKFMKFLNRNAFIITASYGYNFCKSAKEAFGLIFRNLARVAVLDKVTDFVLFLGKITVVSSVCIASFYVFSGSLNGKLPLDLEAPSLNYYFVPIIIITISAYMIATCFFSVFTMAVDTIFLCFLLDIEKNENEENPVYHMSKKLMQIHGLKNAKKTN